jgi:1-acyl-sn-glycerol-3-phosphate acyltransferase
MNIVEVKTETSIPDSRKSKRYYFEATPTRILTIEIARVLFKSVTVIHAISVNNLSSSGAVVLAANHITNFDGFLMQFVIPRTILFMGKAELYRNPLLDIYVCQLGTFPVKQGERDVWAIDHAKRVLEQGKVLGIFAEGKRSKGRGLRAAKTGAGRLAIATQSPIVPVAIDGTQNILKKFPERTPTTIIFGKPIAPSPSPSPASLTDTIMFSIAELLPEEMRGVYANRPEGY